MKVPIEVYTESTPNPETMKFVVNKMILPQKSAEFINLEETKEAPLAAELLKRGEVKSIFISNNFITVTKEGVLEWIEIAADIRQFIRDYLANGGEVFTPHFQVLEKNDQNKVVAEDSVIVKQIKSMLENHVKPAVEMDGGAIQFKSFNEGKVTLELQGACSGCPSSMVTLKNGIEGMMKQMIPGVEEVVAEEV